MRVLRGVYRWLDLRIDFRAAFGTLLFHPVPGSIGWAYVFGSMTLTAFIVQVVTGVALAMTYVPSTQDAYESLRFISETELLGSVIRGIHFWGATAMVVLLLIHMTRTFLWGSFKFPRELNWLSGSVLLLMTLAMAFTGQLLRWDQDSFWGIVVLAEQAGKTPIIGPTLAEVAIAGQQVGAATLTRFFATHVFLIPAVIFAVLGLHIYLVVRRGISDPPEPGAAVEPAREIERYEGVLRRHGVPFFPDVAWRDVVASTVLVLLVLGIAIVIGPPGLREPADPTLVKANPRPDWYFLPYFALLSLIPPEAENVVILGVPIAIGIFLVLVPFIGDRGERHWSRRPWAVASVGIGVIAGAVLLVQGDVAPWSPRIDLAEGGELPATVTRDLDAQQRSGASLFRERACFACHIVAGQGGQRGPDLSDVGTRLSRDQLVLRIVNGGRNMPAFGNTLTPQQLDDLVAFLRTLKGGASR